MTLFMIGVFFGVGLGFVLGASEVASGAFTTQDDDGEDDRIRELSDEGAAAASGGQSRVRSLEARRGRRADAEGEYQDTRLGPR